MDKRQERTLTAFQNVLIYLEQHPITPAPPLLSRMVKQLGTSMQRIKDLSDDQYDAQSKMAASVDERRRRLRRDHMMPLVRLAKPLLAYAPGAETALSVPHARDDALTVAAAALRMATFLEPHRRLLKDAGYSRTYLAEFKAEARDLALIARRSADARKRRTSATETMAREFKDAMNTVTVLEGLVMHHHGADKLTFRLWRNRRRVGARVGRPKVRKAARSRHQAAAS